jgi:alpha-D-xyloside xylohydrolase
MKTVWKKWNLVGLITMTLSLSVFLLNAACVSDEKKNVVLELEQGTLSLIPLNRNAVRVQFTQSGSVPMQELIYTENSPVPEYEVAEDDKSLTLSLEGISVEFDKGTEALTFKDANKRIILQEKVGGRFMAASSVQGEATF